MSQALLCTKRKFLPTEHFVPSHMRLWRDFCAAGGGLAERGTEEHGVKLGQVSRQKMCILQTTVTKKMRSQAELRTGGSKFFHSKAPQDSLYRVS